MEKPNATKVNKSRLLWLVLTWINQRYDYYRRYEMYGKYEK